MPINDLSRPTARPTFAHRALATPDASARTASPSATTDSWEPTTRYTVRSGDTLSAIAHRTLGNANRWTEIFGLNRDQLSRPDRIQPGMSLKIPARAGKAPVGPAPERPQAPARRDFADEVRPARVPPRDPRSIGHAASDVKSLSPEALKHWGRADKRKFFDALRPAAEETERRYGVPAAVTLAQAALESGWGSSAIGGYNLFGIKGSGPSGKSHKVATEEYSHGRRVRTRASFAHYDNFQQAVMSHGEVFHNGYYQRALQQFEADQDPKKFARNISRTYASDPKYASKLIDIMEDFDLVQA